MATTRETLNSQDPLTMLLNLVGKTAQGAGQGVYQDPNTGARNFSILQGGGGALSGAADSIVQMKQLKLQEEQMKHQMEIQDRAMKIQEEQHKQNQAEFARQQEARNIELQAQHDKAVSEAMKSGYGKQVPEGTVNYVKDPKTGKLVKSQSAKETEWMQQYEGKPLPTVDMNEQKVVNKKGGVGRFAGPLGMMANIGQKDQLEATGETLKVPIVPGSNSDGSIGKIDVRSIMDDDYMTRIGQALATDPRFTPVDRSRLIAEWKVEKQRTTQAHYEASAAVKQSQDMLLQNKMITPDEYNSNMQMFGQLGARKEPEIAHAFAKASMALLSGDPVTAYASMKEMMTNLITRVNPFTDTAFRMGMPSTYNAANPTTLTNYGKPVSEAAKAAKNRIKK